MSNENKKRLPVAKLTPAAARLYAALITQLPGDTYDEIEECSGITSCLTMRSARAQLKALGFIVMRDGRECPAIAPEPPEHTVERQAKLPYIGIITKAKQTQ